MASIVGHALGATVAWEAAHLLTRQRASPTRRRYVLPCVAALVPDLDVVGAIFVPALRDSPHRGASHSLVVAVAVAAVVAAVGRLRARDQGFLHLFALLLPCACVHPLLDFCMARGPGVQFLWPFSTEGWLSPMQLVPTAYYARSATGLVDVAFYWRTWVGIGLECLSLGGLLLALRARPGRRAPWLVGALVSFFAIWSLYS
ncbi:MAG: metal-dependent hydrolase [Planctomycetota bacterium]|jgi:membrane-bound metal-dependent hydrolase YbcI (DUF457 family)